MAYKQAATPSGHKVMLTLTVSLSRRQAELTAGAIYQGRGNQETLVAEIPKVALKGRAW